MLSFVINSLNCSSSLHLHDFVEGLYFHCSLSVCLCVCVCVCLSVCPEILVNKIPAEQMHRFGRGFAKSLLLALTRTLLNIVTLGQRSRSQWLISLMYISVFLYLIKLKFGMPLTYALCKFVCEFHWNQKSDDVIVTSFKFYTYKCPYFKFYWTYKLHFWYKHSKT